MTHAVSRSLAALVVAAVLPGWPDGCDRRPAQDAATPAAQAVRAVATGIVAADNAADVEAVLAFYAEGAVLIPPDGEAITDRRTIRQRYEALFCAEQAELVAHVDDVSVSGDLAIVRGRNSGRFLSRTTGVERPVADVYLMALRQGVDGRWRISHLMWHPGR